MRFNLVSLLTVCGLAALSLGAGCTTLPDLADTVTPAAEAAPYPALVPLDPLLAEANDRQTTSPGTAAAQNARAAALRARAAQMQAAAGQ